MTTSRIETIAAHDGQEFAGTLVLPGGGRGPGVVLLQEIFGVNDFLLAKAASLAELGYVVLCPDVFWRVEPGTALAHDEAGLQQGFSLVGRYMEGVPEATKVADLLAAEQHLRALPEVVGGVAAMGYCLGGLLAYLIAVNGSPDACVSYYGSGIADRLDDAERIICPTLFHFGGRDPYIAREQIDRVDRAFAGRDDVRVRIEPEAGHAFENLLAPAFADPAAAARSWPVTSEFLANHLGR
jgi:carboxymethylenebutenolidase